MVLVIGTGGVKLNAGSPGIPAACLRSPGPIPGARCHRRSAPVTCGARSSQSPSPQAAIEDDAWNVEFPSSSDRNRKSGAGDGGVGVAVGKQAVKARRGGQLHAPGVCPCFGSATRDPS